MQAGEIVFIAAAVIIIFFSSQHLRKFRTTKTEVIVNAVSLVILLTLFIINLVTDFSYQKLIIVSLFVLMGSFTFYNRYKKFKRGDQGII